jgi:hypothetical protein
VEQTNLYYQHVDRQAGPSHRLPDIKLWDIMTFIALVLEMGHDLKDKHDYWSRLIDSYTLCSMVIPWHEIDFYTYCTFCILQTTHIDLNKKLGDELGSTYDTHMCLGKDSCSATDDTTATHATVRHLTRRVEGLGHNLFTDIFFLHQDFLMTLRQGK